MHRGEAVQRLEGGFFFDIISLLPALVYSFVLTSTFQLNHYTHLYISVQVPITTFRIVEAHIMQ